MEWQVVSIADFSGDGKPDFIWRNSHTGELQAWFMDDARFINHWSLNPGRVADTNWVHCRAALRSLSSTAAQRRAARRAAFLFYAPQNTTRR